METTLRSSSRQAPAMRWAVAAGLFFLGAGVVALASPALGARIAVAAFGWLSLFAAAVEVTHAIEARHEKHSAWYFLAGALYAVAGFLMVFSPGAAVLAAAMTLGLLLVLRALVLGAIAYQLRRTRVWALFGLDGLVSAVLGIVLLAGWPTRAVMVLGICFGAGLIVNGLSRLLVAAGLRSQGEGRLPPASGAAVT